MIPYRSGCSAVLVLLCCLSMPPAGAEAVPDRLAMGMLGDSLTDEYLPAPNLAKTDLAAYSWVQILALTRPEFFNFGEYRTRENYWPDIRGAGFEYNWAKVGSAASSATRLRVARIFTMKTGSPFMGSSYLQDQVIGMVPYVRRGEVDAVFIGAGSNDFFYHTNNFTIDGKAKPLSDIQITQDFIDSVAGALLAAVDSLRSAGAEKVVLALLPMGTASEDGDAQVVLDGIAAVNAILVDAARERDIATVALFGFAREIGRVNADGSVNIAGKVLVPNSAATAEDLAPEATPGVGPCNSSNLCALPAHADHYRAEDGLHPNTLIQGLIANQVLRALNSHYQSDIPTLTDDEIIELAVGAQ